MHALFARKSNVFEVAVACGADEELNPAGPVTLYAVVNRMCAWAGIHDARTNTNARISCFINPLLSQ